MIIRPSRRPTRPQFQHDGTTRGTNMNNSHDCPENRKPLPESLRRQTHHSTPHTPVTTKWWRSMPVVVHDALGARVVVERRLVRRARLLGRPADAPHRHAPPLRPSTGQHRPSRSAGSRRTRRPRPHQLRHRFGRARMPMSAALAYRPDRSQATLIATSDASPSPTNTGLHLQPRSPEYFHHPSLADSVAHRRSTADTPRARPAPCSAGSAQRG
ncbi:hypothetical protein A8926_4059 [Saccharopolyspora spinosa]|uniref:Uncharacterized protein n=1 Tax=Saccharopolyspora spinosa TaxID=60894 RepID=A0A2N3Y007_SACSN|nr:hypothetical protein A8926_4059 [Saccharopolyspora spinosa]